MKNIAVSPASAAWLPLSPSDFDAVDRIAQAIHVDIYERTEVLFDKASFFPQGCRKLVRDGAILGYAIAHPWFINEIPEIDQFLPKRDEAPDCLFLHDVAVLPAARGSNAAAALLALLRPLARARNLRFLACVSVYGTDRLWSRFGFTAISRAGIDAKLASYGPTAKYMVAPA
jgi:GNAT superfamily N-acetyltransferase